jgi:hypothetical protein
MRDHAALLQEVRDEIASAGGRAPRRVRFALAIAAFADSMIESASRPPGEREAARRRLMAALRAARAEWRGHA